MNGLQRLTPAAAGVLLSAACLLGGCAAPQTRALLASPPSMLQATVKLEQTPFFPQQDYECGPAALATVLVSAGVKTTPETLTPQVYLPGRQGALQAEMLAATRRQGVIPYVLAPRLEAVLQEIAGGRPVVVLQNLSLPWWPRWHYAVAIGYDRDREQILLRSGTTRELQMSLSNFEHTWARSGHWAMVAVAPQALPDTALEVDYVAAVAALEKVSPATAIHAYQTALRRWPRNLIARMGMGNAAYARGDLVAAEAAYRRASADHPASADAWNNLAQVLYEQNRKEEALRAAHQAVALGGPRASQYRATLDAIAANP